jgi:hypothetical protein
MLQMLNHNSEVFLLLCRALHIPQNRVGLAHRDLFNLICITFLIPIPLDIQPRLNNFFDVPWRGNFLVILI